MSGHVSKCVPDLSWDGEGDGCPQKWPGHRGFRVLVCPLGPRLQGGGPNVQSHSFCLILCPQPRSPPGHQPLLTHLLRPIHP